jgi:hypothetical protein
MALTANRWSEASAVPVAGCLGSVALRKRAQRAAAIPAQKLDDVRR